MWLFSTANHTYKILLWVLWSQFAVHCVSSMIQARHCTTIMSNEQTHSCGYTRLLTLVLLVLTQPYIQNLLPLHLTLYTMPNNPTYGTRFLFIILFCCLHKSINDLQFILPICYNSQTNLTILCLTWPTFYFFAGQLLNNYWNKTFVNLLVFLFNFVVVMVFVII